jgi:hypothetical protein
VKVNGACPAVPTETDTGAANPKVFEMLNALSVLLAKRIPPPSVSVPEPRAVSEAIRREPA